MADRRPHALAGRARHGAVAAARRARRVRAVPVPVPRAPGRARARHGPVRAADRRRRRRVPVAARAGRPAGVPAARRDVRGDRRRARVLQLLRGGAHGRRALGAPRPARRAGRARPRRDAVARVPHRDAPGADARDHERRVDRLPLLRDCVRRRARARRHPLRDHRDGDLDPDDPVPRPAHRGGAVGRAARGRRGGAHRREPHAGPARAGPEPVVLGVVRAPAAPVARRPPDGRPGARRAHRGRGRRARRAPARHARGALVPRPGRRLGPRQLREPRHHGRAQRPVRHRVGGGGQLAAHRRARDRARRRDRRSGGARRVPAPPLARGSARDLGARLGVHAPARGLRGDGRLRLPRHARPAARPRRRPAHVGAPRADRAGGRRDAARRAHGPADAARHRPAPARGRRDPRRRARASSARSTARSPPGRSGWRSGSRSPSRSGSSARRRSSPARTARPCRS